ncbi:DUF262 domain-containing protein [Lachnoclostridium phytofermentans]|uniref:DUF262 domain-containing protein n=1 Tax=Lachnoclostridium phytofermentans TaxID=66219 RepID=UPI00192E3177|nr:DUF262 domain-containing protein [Lachnoclostridium phytofermentans]
MLLKTINELSTYSFHIPAYQRGYRWSHKEVMDLLNDINDFVPRLVNEDTNEKTWYCLQPIVVKQSGEEYEVIDGQQRLTTIFLVWHYLNQDFVEKKRDKLFNLSYETRLNTQNFLNNLNDDNEINDSNVDFYYISIAYKTICDWFETRDINFDRGEFRSKFKFYSKVIWYESFEEDSIAIFTRINIGKIPLTNAELIKALFLNSSNFEKAAEEKLRLRQLEIASEWDNIEQKLQDNRLWFFLTGNKKETNRIEFIFDLMNDDADNSDTYSTFRYFSKKLNDNNIDENWKEVKKYYQSFLDWYDDRELYHKIGYIICISSTTIKKLYNVSITSTKSEFKNYLDDAVKSELKNVKLDELQYSDRKNVEKVLLLYNILTMIKTTKDNSYFPFDLYKTGRWDIEHITSIKDSIPDKNREEWLKDAIPFIDDSFVAGTELKERAKECDWKDESEFKKIFEDIVMHFNQYINDDDINDITNLTLLDSNTNRGYKNAVFPLKRKTIIDKDKSGVFIPICTKNVFLKYFSDYPPKISFWTQEDREKYEQDLYNVLNGYISGGQND